MTRYAAVLLLLLIFILFTYNLWWLAPFGSALIILLSYAAWPGRNLDLLGLKIPPVQGLISLLIAAVAAATAWILVSATTPTQGIAVTPLWQRGKWFALVVHTIGQTLNEEMLLGSLLLKSIAGRFQRLSLAAVSILAALAFSLLHYAFYAFRPPDIINYGMLSLVALASIFAAGLLRNNCILSTGNIGFAWAIHFGWNLIFIDSLYIYTTSQAELSEPELFNAVFGNSAVLLLVAVAAGLSFLLFSLYTTQRSAEGSL